MGIIRLLLTTFARPMVWLLLAVLLGVIAQNVLRQGMPQPVSPRYTHYAIPAAVSLLRGHPHDYSAQMSVADFFLRNPDGDTNQQIQQALRAKDLDPTAIWLVSGDDKGLIDLTYAAFLLFGPAVKSIVKAVLLLTGLSLLFFTLQFGREDSKMAALASVLCGLYAVLFTVGLTQQSMSIAEPRLIGVISIASSLHLMMLVGRNRPLSLPERFLALAQLCILVFVIHLRSSEVWQALALLAFALCAAILRAVSWRRALLFAMLPVIGLAALSTYKHATFNERYFGRDISTRVFWHNALIGLAINPTLHEKYGLSTLDDVSATEAVRRSMIENGRSEAAAALFPSEYISDNFKNFGWSNYENEARKLYLHIAADDTGEVFKTYTQIVPEIMIGDIDYLSSRSGPQALPYLVAVVQAVSPEVRRQRDLFFTLLRPLPLAAMFAVFLILLTGRSPEPGPGGAMIVLFLASLIPPTLATPAIQYIQLSLMLGTSALYLLAATLSAKLVRPALRSWRQRPSFKTDASAMLTVRAAGARDGPSHPD